MNQVGLFFGSFNPIHIGHLALANYMCEFEELDQVWFVVSPQNPFKSEDELIDARHRINMAQKATDAYPHFKVEDIELSLPTPSFTIDTLDELSKLHPNCHFHLIMGADNIQNIYRWKDAERLVKEHRILVYPRLSYQIDIKELPHNVKVTKAPLIEISSTQIRDWIKANKDLPFLTTPEVRDYIYINRLYK